MVVKFLIDNKTEHPECNAEWGLSMIVESNGHRVLYDTGASNMLLENAKAMNESLDGIECIIISHGHSDHTGGIKYLIEKNKDIKIYMHKDGFGKMFGSETEGVIDDYDCGTGFTDEFVSEITQNGNLIKTEGITVLNDVMTIVGDIPDLSNEKPTETFFKFINGKYVIDNMNHEQFLVVKEGDGIHIISGCCHKGAIPTVLYAKQLFPGMKIKSLIGGMHLYAASKKKCIEIADKLKESGVENIVPLHCTGMNTIITLKEEFGDFCHIECAGSVLEI